MAGSSPSASIPATETEASAEHQTSPSIVDNIHDAVDSHAVNAENKCNADMSTKEENESPKKGDLDQLVPEIVGDEETEQELHIQQQIAKISGYLEKKGKLRMVSSWKKYWFVLEGRLLLYYRSRAEYDTLSPCKGSITLGAPCNIKPGPASHCVFQIETRNNTIILRAENRAEQDKWMLAILGALNQTASCTNQTKLSHFRYSADDLAVRTPTDKPQKPMLLRQNTLPERIKEIPKDMEKTANKKKESPPKTPKTIVERLQGIGAQSYVANTAFDSVKLSKASSKLPKNENLKKLLDKIPLDTVEVSAIQDDWIKEEDVEVYGEIKENELYDMLDPSAVQAVANEGTTSEDIMIENLVYVTVDENADGIMVKEQAENDKHIYQEIPSKDNRIIIIENSEYAQVPVDHNKNKVEYCEPVFTSSKDEYATIQDEPALPPRPTNNTGQEKEKLGKKVKDGEKATRLRKLAKMVKEERKDGGKRQSFVVRMFKKIKKHDNNKEEAKAKNKEQETEIEIAQELPNRTYDSDALPIRGDGEDNLNNHEDGPEINPKLVDELKGAFQGRNDISHEVLQRESKTEDNLIEELPLADKVTAQENHVDDDWIQEDMSLVNEIAELRDNKENDTITSSLPNEDEPSKDTSQQEPTSSQLEQLSQLQQPQLPLKQKRTEKYEPVDHPTATLETKPIDSTDFDYDIYDSSQRLNIPRPKLISKTKRQKRITNTASLKTPHHSRYHQLIKDREENNDDERHRHSLEDKKLMTIDEILDDLENHTYEPFSRQKVKDLIEKFNEHDTEHETDEDVKEEEEIHVELRRKRLDHSEELSSLLNELSKVTNAPVSSSEAANSLGVNGPYSEEEWKNIVPIRKRRHSDPDYDIPRPHSALQIIPSNEKEETKMQPTRFFGPVIIEHINGDSISCGTSITPDSLEVDVNHYPVKNYTPSIEEDRSMRSYTSHIYSSNESHLNNANISHHSHNNQKPNKKSDAAQTINVEPITEKSKDDIYANPKALSSLIVPKTECEHAFYLNNNNNSNNFNNNNLNNLSKDESHKIATAAKRIGEDRTNSMCFDSLEPFVEDAVK